MLVTRRLEIEALIVVLLIVSRAGVEVMALNGKSRLIISKSLYRRDCSPNQERMLIRQEPFPRLKEKE